jgi:hypothetical protein
MVAWFKRAVFVCYLQMISLSIRINEYGASHIITPCKLYRQKVVMFHRKLEMKVDKLERMDSMLDDMQAKRHGRWVKAADTPVKRHDRWVKAADMPVKCHDKWVRAADMPVKRRHMWVMVHPWDHADTWRV